MNSMEHHELVEQNEAAAYRSLVAAAERTGQQGFRSQHIGGACALLAPSLPRMVLLNRVIGLGVSEPATEDQVAELAQLYTETNVAWGVESSPSARPETLPGWLKAKRLRKGPASAMFLRRCKAIPEAETDLQIRPWRPTDGDSGAMLAAEVFKVPQEVERILAQLPRQPHWRQWLAFDGDTPVATSLLFINGDVAWAGWAATRPSYRGRGLHSALVAAWLRDAADHGCEWVTTDTAIGTPEKPDPSYRNHIRLGFQSVHVRHTHVAVPTRM